MGDTSAPAPESQEPTPEQKEATFLEDLQRHVGGLREEEKKKAKVWDLLDPKTHRPAIASEEDANLVAGAFARAEEEIERIQIQAEKRIKRAKDRYFSLEFVFKTALESWTAQRIGRSKKKFIDLEEARVKFRKVPGGVRTVNMLALTEWAEKIYVEACSYPAVVSITKVADWEAKHKKLAPGRESFEEHEKFSIQRLKKGAE
jgi:hypothetical protein